MDDGRAGVEVENFVIGVSVKAVDVEDSFDVLCGDLFDDIGIEQANAEGLRRGVRSVSQQLLDGLPSGGVKIALDGSVTELDDNFFRTGRVAFALLR